MFNLILFGPPGSGKGTQSEKLIREYGFIHLSTGELLRAEIARKTPLGLEARKFMDQGLLVPDEIVIGMISSMLDSHPGARGFLFDGFPRTATQAVALDRLLALKKTGIHLVASLEVPEEELLRRLLNRGITSGRSDDAHEGVVRARIEEYHRKTASVAEYYTLAGTFKTIRGEGSIEEIFGLLRQLISSSEHAG